MTDPQREAGWMGDATAQHLTPREMARHLVSCPECLQSMGRAGEESQPVRRLERARRDSSTVADALLGKTLESGTSRLAVVLYELGRLTLAVDEQWRRAMEHPGLNFSWGEVREEGQALIERLPHCGLTAGDIPESLPGRQHMKAATEATRALARRIAPEWSWLDFGEALSLQFEGRASEAGKIFGNLIDDDSDQHLSYWALRNLGDSAVQTSNSGCLELVVSRLADGWSEDPAAHWFVLEHAALRGDLKALDRSLESLLSHPVDTADGYWKRHLREQLSRIGVASGLDLNRVLAKCAAAGWEIDPNA